MKEHYTRFRRSPRLFELLYFPYSALLCLILISPFTLHSQCSNNVVLSISGPTVSDWTAPATGGPFLVQIEATGASGGSYLQSNPDRFGGSGATMIGEFIVQNGEKIRAIAGGGGYHSDLEGGGGGGGSGAVNCGTSANCPSGNVLIIAAGGCGGHLFGDINSGQGNGLAGSSATNGSGLGGSISINDDSGGGGGGLSGDGQSAPSGGDGGEQVDPDGLSLGGAGSWNMAAMSGNNRGGDGMGGGGGGGDGGTEGVDNASGGGGGHSGGWGGNAQAASSFNSGSNQSNTDGTMGGGTTGPKGTPSDPGTVTITCLNVLPVSLVNFRGFLQDERMSLVWSTATEIDNMGFDIEHSVDGRNWSTLGFVSGHGTTIQHQDYSFEHADPQFGVNYYRLKQVDYDGNYEYSPIVVVDNRNTQQKIEIFPNPSTDGALSLRLLSKRRGKAGLEVFDWTGLRVYKDTVTLEKGTMVWPISMTTFPKGAYTAKLELPSGEVLFKKVLLQ